MHYFVYQRSGFTALTNKHDITTPAIPHNFISQRELSTNRGQLLYLLRAHSQQLDLVFIAFLYRLD